MDEDEKSKKIQGLVNYRYPLPVLQELLAELVMETQDFYRSDSNVGVEGRFKKVRTAFFGSEGKHPAPPLGKDDSELINRALYFMEVENLRPFSACEEAAKEYYIGPDEYRFKMKMPKNFQDNEVEAIKSTTHRLYGKIKKEEEQKRALKHYMEEDAYGDYMAVSEAAFINKAMTLWRKRYGSYLDSSKFF